MCNRKSRLWEMGREICLVAPSANFGHWELLNFQKSLGDPLLDSPSGILH